MTVKHVFKRNPTFLTQIFNFFPIIFYRVPPIFLESESICFGAFTSTRPTFVDDEKYVLSYNLHVMGGIFKEGRIWDSLIKFSFG